MDSMNDLTIDQMVTLLLDNFNVPSDKRDASNPGNVKWLLRNLKERDGKHPNLGHTLTLLRTLEERG